jgi:hypothetical protein
MDVHDDYGPHINNTDSLLFDSYKYHYSEMECTEVGLFNKYI